VKTCLKCDLRTRDSDVECTNCSTPFNYVSDEPDSDYELYIHQIENPTPLPLKVETSRWTKVIATCLILLVAMFGYQQFQASKLSDCKSNVFQVTMLIKVLDVRVSWLQCEYLIQHDNFGIGSPNKPDWVPQYILNIYIKSEADVKNN
jgi:hypothetical protein